MADNFTGGESDAYGAGAPPIETMGARYGIGETMFATQSPGDHVPLSVPYLMPSVHYRNGNMERINPAIVQTPLGGMMPGPMAIAPAVPSGGVGTTFPPDPSHEEMEFGMGVVDGWPEGSPVPY